MKPPISPLLALLLIACRTGDKIDEGEVIDTGDITETPDADADGYDASEDCDDANSVVNPGAAEICDGVDNNCDGVVDEGVTTTFYADTDGDGFGDAESTIEACEEPDDFVPIGNDCDDTNGEVYPSAPERCDGLDNDCDGDIDEDLTEFWYADADGDGAGDPDAGVETCDPKQGYVETGEDCDDTNPTAFPGGEEVCDEADNDCDGETDEGVTTTFYEDVDSDGYGIADTTTESCDLPTGYAESTGDCDDADSAINPDATEVCDGLDNNCDGTVDEDTATDAATWYADADADGYGDAADSTLSCDQPSGTVSDSSDCDDADSTANPGAAEVCDEVDNDCDGSTDEGVTTTYYADTDADGFGDSASTTSDCSVPSGYSASADDCDDSDSAINPDASEVCNDTDDDCDGSVDEGVTETFYEDADADGYGDSDSTTTDCEAPSGYSADDTDCDDADSAINPGATEVCDEVDNDCDGSTDEGAASAETFYADDDGDGYGDPDFSTTDCEAPSGYVGNAEDCDDGNNTISPDGTEVCNGEDDDCDGSTDEDVASPDTFYADDDGDGYGDPDATTEDCEVPSGYSADDTDCDDADSAINPGASEVCNGEDDDCDSDVDEGVLGTGEACSADDCLTILTADSSAADGDYWVDFDGTATETECDMTTDGGGWTLIFEDDFESTPDAGWSLSTTSVCGSWSTLLGGYGVMAGGEIDITVDTYALAHTEVWVELEYAKLDSWDGEEAYVDIDGTNVWSDFLYYYDGSEVCGWNRGWSGSYDDLHAISEITNHTASAVELIAGSTLNQVSTDESFGIDDVVVWVR